MKALLKFVLIIAIIAVGAGIAKDFAVKMAVEKGFKSATGMELTASKIHVGLLGTQVDAQGLRIAQPRGYGEGTMIDAPRIFADVNVSDYFKNLIHIEDAEINLNQITLIRENGQLNIQALVPAPTPSQEAPAKAPAAAKEVKAAGAQKSIQIDRLRVVIGKINFQDTSMGIHQTINFNYDRTFTGITDIRQLAGPIVMDAIMKTPLGQIAGLDVQGLMNSMNLGGLSFGQIKQLSQIKDLAKDALGSVTKGMDALQNGLGGLKQGTADSAAGAAAAPDSRSAADALFGKLKALSESVGSSDSK